MIPYQIIAKKTSLNKRRMKTNTDITGPQVIPDIPSDWMPEQCDMPHCSYETNYSWFRNLLMEQRRHYAFVLKYEKIITLLCYLIYSASCIAFLTSSTNCSAPWRSRHSKRQLWFRCSLLSGEITMVIALGSASAACTWSTWLKAAESTSR